MVAERLPPISDPISILNMNIMTQIVNSILILIFTILTMIIFDKVQKNAPVPIRMRLMTLFFKCFLKRVHRRDYWIRNLKYRI